MADPFGAARTVIDAGVARQAFPAAVIEVGDATRPLWTYAAGRLTYDTDAGPTGDDTVFDLASLTKVISTASLAMRQVERGAIALDDPVSRSLPMWTVGQRHEVTLRDLLAHASGLPAHRPLHMSHRGIAAFVTDITGLDLEYAPRSAALYSDLDFILLGAALETVAPLNVQFDAMRTQMSLAGDLQFRPPANWLPRTAPTRRSPERGRLLVGEVDDENAWALGGVAGHAGLFGTAPAVGEFARHLLQILAGRTGVFDAGLLRTFISRRTDIPGSSRALGWDTMLPTSSCGTRMSPSAFGHTGFTGTSLWIDPERGVYVVLLTNRVHPVPGDAALIRQVRRDVHDAIVAAL